jgi:YD repeat-containing protein
LTPAQIQNLYRGVAQPPAPQLRIGALTNGQITLTWDGSGKLQSTAALQGSQTVWTDEAAVSPATITPTEAARFYRLSVP